jgi:hypothetical protein
MDGSATFTIYDPFDLAQDRFTIDYFPKDEYPASGIENWCQFVANLRSGRAGHPWTILRSHKIVAAQPGAHDSFAFSIAFVML